MMHTFIKQRLFRTVLGISALLFVGLLAAGIYCLTLSTASKDTITTQTGNHSQETWISPKTETIAQVLKFPLYFESNEGQTDASVKYLSRGRGYAFYFTPKEIVMVLQKGSKAEETRSVIKLHFVGANPAPMIRGLEEQESKSHYFIGNDPENWHTNISHYAKVSYQDLYPGFEAVFYGNQEKLEYDILVAPGQNPQNIRLQIEGAKELSIDSTGNLQILIEDEQQLQMQKPFVYQMLAGNQVSIEGQFVLLAHNEVGFAIGAYDQDKLLVIDPVIVYSTYLGGSASDIGSGIAVDSSGNTYITGQTASTNFPTTAGVFQLALAPGASNNAFVTKLNAAGSALMYSTYLGGSGSDQGNSIAIDAGGNAYITGTTTSPNFPTILPFQIAIAGSSDAFVTKLNPTGSALMYSTYLGGSGLDAGTGIAVDATGRAYVTGQTFSANFPTLLPFQAALAGTSNAFVTRFNPAGSTLSYSTYLGGSNLDSGTGIAVDASNSAYVTGLASSANFPITAGVFQPALGAGATSNAFVTKFNPAGTPLIYSTYLGGGSSDFGNFIALDTTGNAYVTGVTNSSNFPTTAGAFQTAIGSIGVNDAFVTKLNTTGTAPLVYSTYLGGTGSDTGRSIAVDSNGTSYITGITGSPNFPTTVSAVQSTLLGTTDAFITKLNPAGSSLVFSSYLGGSAIDQGRGIALDSSHNAYVVGLTASSNFPTTVGAFQTAIGSIGVNDAFVTKFQLGIPIVTSISPNFGPESGGTVVVITGVNLLEATAVNFGLNAGISVIINSDTQITVTSPPGTGTVDVTVTAPSGTSATSPADLFNYQAATLTTLAVSPNPATFGQTVTLTATVSPSSATGTVNFFDGVTLIGTAPLSGGIATLAINNFSVGSHSLTAIYSGATNFQGSTSSPVILIVNQAATSTSLTVFPNPSTFGQTVTLTATVSPSSATGTVSFFDGATLISTVPLSGGTAALSISTFAVGAHSLRAVYSGDTNFIGSTSNEIILIVNKVTTTTKLTVSPNPATVNQAVTLTAIIDPPTPPTGTVSFFDGGILLGIVPVSDFTATLTISTFAVGTHSLTAVYSGDANFSGSTSSPVILIVNQISPPTRLKGVQRANRFATQTDLVNIITWHAPSSGTPPVSYRIYRNSSLTELAAEVSANGRLRFKDHNRKEGKTYTYFIVSVDQFGNISTPATVTISGRK